MMDGKWLLNDVELCGCVCPCVQSNRLVCFAHAMTLIDWVGYRFETCVCVVVESLDGGVRI